MAELSLSIYERKAEGSAAARRYRKAGKIPAVVYSSGNQAIPLLLEDREFVHQATQALPTQVFEFKAAEGEQGLDGLKGVKGIVKEIQRNFQSGNVLHVDFQKLEDGKPLLVTVPVIVKGESPGVKNQGGVLAVQCRKIVVSSLPDRIPSQIEVSVDSLMLGDRVRTRDIELPEGVTLKSNPEETVVNVLSSRASKADEGGEASEGAAAAAAK